MSLSKTTGFEFPEVRMVEASAGSGKTYALAKRYIQLLLHPDLEESAHPIRHILAITFTNKAALEMKARIIEFLKAIALGHLPEVEEQAIIEPLGLSVSEARSKAFDLMEDLIRNYNYFQVQTIDKFINSLLAGCAFKIGLTANFKIKTQAFEYLQYSLDQLIDQIPNDSRLQGLFEAFLHNYLYLENRSGWFPKEDMLKIVYELYKKNNTFGLDFRTGLYTAKDVGKKKGVILAEMKALKEILPDQTNATFRKSLDKFLIRHPKGFDIDSISDYFHREDFPIRKGGEVSDEVWHLWNAIRINLKQLCEEESQSLFNPYIGIFNEVKKGFSAMTSKDDVLFIEQLNKKATALFGEDGISVEELYYRLATRFRHYLIDEFQDTSRLQWHNLETMIEEGLSTGGSMYYVGDRKQAIYSFRGGEVKLFDEVKNRFKPYNIQTDLLTQNWRSEKSIVDFNNQVFSVTNLRRFIIEKEIYEEEMKRKSPVIFQDKDFSALEDVFQGAQQTHQKNNSRGYVQVEHLDDDSKGDRDEVLRDRILDLIKELKTRFTYRDIAILTRSNREVEKITRWLLEENILVNSERTSNIKENQRVEDIIAFLQFLHSPIDNPSFVNFIFGEVFLKASGMSFADCQDFVFGLRSKIKSKKDVYIYTEFREAFPEVWEEFIDPFFKNVGLYPIYEFLVSIYETWNVFENFPNQQGFFMHFLEMIKKQEEEFTDIGAFLNYFENVEGEDLYVQLADNDAVRILTVHKSKGLEFPVVILPGLAMDIQVGSSSGNKQSYVLKPSKEDAELLRLKRKYYGYSDELYHIYAEEYRKSFFSELNNIYVALTRPQRELYIFIPKKVQQTHNWVRFLIPDDAYVLGKRVTYNSKAQADPNVMALPLGSRHNWMDYLQDEFLAYEDISHREQRLQGAVRHVLLSHVTNLQGQDLNSVMESAMSQTKDSFDQVQDWDVHQEWFSEFLKRKDTHPYFYVDDGDVLTEQEVIDSYGHTRRVDRLIVKQKEVVVVDFKLSVDKQGRYHKQIQEYIKLLETIYPNKDISGVLVYMDGNSNEMVQSCGVGA